MKPSFSFMGIHSVKETILQAEQLAQDPQHIAALTVIVQRIQSVCQKAIKELKEKL